MSQTAQVEDLVLAYRILAAHGVVDAYGHVSVRTEGDPHRYLLARAMAPELVTTVPLKPLFNTGAFIGEGIPTFEIRDFQQSGDLIIKTPHLGASLAKVLGPKPAALMRGHGSVVVGESLMLAVVRSVYLELSAKLQMQAMLIAGPNGKIVYLDENEVAATSGRQASAGTWKRTWDLWCAKARAQIASEQSAKRRRSR